LEKHGVVTHIERAEGTGTGSNMIVVVQGEDRRFHVDVGANQFLDPRLVRDVLRKEKPCVLCVGAPDFLGHFDEQLPRILKEAKEELNCVTFVDPIPPYRHSWEYLERSFEWIDVLHCNNVEAGKMTSRKPLKHLTALQTEE
jgi:sugar/nucleoside kinase (ribokinase family)